MQNQCGGCAETAFRLGAPGGTLRSKNRAQNAKSGTLEKHRALRTLAFAETVPASGTMGLESLLDPPEPSQLTGEKRLPAFSDVGRDAKRLCTQPDQLPPGSVDSRFSDRSNSWGGFRIASNPESGDAASQYEIDAAINWSNAELPGFFGGLDSTANAQEAGADPFLFDFIPAQMGDMNMQSSLGADRPYQQPEIQGNTNTFDLHYSVDANKATIPRLQLSHDPGASYNSNKLESMLLPDQFHSPFTEPLVDGTSTWIDSNTDPENGSGYQPLGAFASPGFEAIEIAPKAEGTLVTSLEEATSVGSEDTSEFWSTLIDHNKDSSGKPIRKQTLILKF